MLANPETFTFVILVSVMVALIGGMFLSKAAFMARFQTSTVGNLITVLVMLSGFALNQLSPYHVLRAVGAFAFFLAFTLGIRRKSKSTDGK